MLRRPLIVLALSLGVMITAKSFDSNAADDFRQNAVGVCQGALPAFEGQIRKRPIAISNEGNSIAFVSCSLGSQATTAHNFFSLTMTNTNDFAVDVSCTIVSGRAFSGARYYPVTRSFAAREVTGVFTMFDNSVDTANLLNASCALPPGVELNYLESIGP